jgi:hypothetical protein
MHQNDVHSQSMQPGRKNRIGAEGTNLAKNLQKCQLRKVLGLRRIPDHSQAQALDAPAVGVVKVFEGRSIAFLRSPDGFWFSQFMFRSGRGSASHVGFTLGSFKYASQQSPERKRLWKN